MIYDGIHVNKFMSGWHINPVHASKIHFIRLSTLSSRLDREVGHVLLVRKQ